MKHFFMLMGLSLIIVNFSSAQIKLDENFEDWSDIPLAYDDSGDNVQGNIGFGEFKLYDDSRYLYFLLDVGKEINLQDDNEITIYIDTDNNSSTGINYAGLGVDLEFTFGKRLGRIHTGNSSENVYQSDIGLISSPTVSSSRFEFALDRNSQLSSIMNGGNIRIAFANGSSGDVLPNEQGGVVYQLTDNEFIPPYYQIKKSNSTDFRVMTFNVERDHIFESGQQIHYENMIKAIAPDIIGFQEIYDHSSAQTADLVNRILPGNWYHASESNDNICVSKYPIIASTNIDANAAFLIDMGDSTETRRLLFISAHPPCCNNNDQRQAEIDNIMAFVRDSKNGTGKIPIEENTPVIIVGDMNLVGFARQQYTFYSGDIFDEQRYGSDFVPDWDGTFLDDNKPVTVATPFTFTWYSEGSSFSPGRLDYIIYTGSVLEAVNSFALFTGELPADTLDYYGLNSDDSKLASDHIPVAVDFKFKFTNNLKEQIGNVGGFELEQNYPNPFGPGIPGEESSTVIKYSVPSNINSVNGKNGSSISAASDNSQIQVMLKVYDVLGRETATLVNEMQPAGEYVVKFDASVADGMSTGVYFYRLLVSPGRYSENFMVTKKMIFVK